MLAKMFGDKAVLAGLLTKLFQGISGPVTAVMVLNFFSPELQGYYYTFGSLIALQVFVELGFSAVITTFSAHEWAKLSVNGDGEVVGDRRALSRLASLARSALRWYLSGAAILLVVLLIVGLWFFRTETQTDDVQWFAPWIALCSLATGSFVLTPAWALLIGCGQIKSVNGYRLVETALRSGATWIAIALGASLWAAVVSVGMAALSASCFLVVRYRRFFTSIFLASSVEKIGWRKRILPLQTKIAISWLSGYFAFSIFTPITFHFLGARAAGQMGMTWAFVSGLSGLAATWVQVRSPHFAVLVAQRDFRKLDSLAKSTFWFGTLVCISGGFFALIAIAIVSDYRPDIASRFLPIGAISVFMLAESLHQISMVQSTYLRAFKQEPFLWISVSTGLTVGLGTYFLTKPFEGYGAAVSYLLGILMSLVWGTIIFNRYRREWTLKNFTAAT